MYSRFYRDILTYVSVCDVCRHGFALPGWLSFFIYHYCCFRNMTQVFSISFFKLSSCHCRDVSIRCLICDALLAIILEIISLSRHRIFYVVT